MRNNKTVLTCAVTGAVTSREQTPHLPVTPEEIATSALEAAEAGAAVVHIHVRDVITGRPSMELDHYRDVVDRIKKQNNDVLINLTTGPGGFFIPDLQRIEIAGKGTTVFSAEKRVKHIQMIKPDLCSLDFNTMNQAGDGIRLNHKKIVKQMLHLIQEAGTKPELEIFGSGDFMLAREYVKEGLVKGNPLWQFALGVKYGFECTHEAVNYCQSMLPENSLWSAFGIGREEMPIVANTWLLGGHVRVGLEDNIYLEKGVLAKTNAELVTKAVRIIKDLGGEIATYDEARKIYLS